MKFLKIETCFDCKYRKAPDGHGLKCGHEMAPENNRVERIPSWCPLQGTCDSCEHCKEEKIGERGVQDDSFKISHWVDIMETKCGEYLFNINDPSTMSCPAYERRES